MLSVRPEKIRGYVACPQFGDTNYGAWGALRLDQRKAIKDLCEWAICLEKMLDKEMKNSKILPIIRECHKKLGFLENCIGGSSQNINGQIEAYNNILRIAENKVPRETNKRCPICHELCPEDDMIDTEGMVNGGIGAICPDCAENGDVGR